MSEKSYAQIMKSSSLVGGAQVIKLIIGMARVKFVAVLLGPTGIGLQGMFMAISTMAATVSGLGINDSGVREVAEAAGSTDQERIARTVITLRRMCWITGMGGALIMAALAKPISVLTFQTDTYAWHIVFLSLSVLLGSLSAGQMALIQGMRRIGDLARLNVLTALIGSVIAVVFFWWLGIEGIVPSLLSLSIVSLTGSFYYARRITLVPIEITWRESLLMSGGLVTLGLAFMWTGLLAAGVAYLTRALIIQNLGLPAVGIYTAAFALSGMFINFVLGAMGADFYPSLTAVSNDHEKMCDLVNQQTEVGLLLALPGLLATLALAPWIIKVFYTSAFAQSADLLQWFVLGCLGQVISWPMGYIIIAKGAGRIFVFGATLTNFIHLSLVWAGLKWFGIEGVAIAFCVLYVYHITWSMIITRYLIQFSWSTSARRLILVLLPIGVITMLQSRLLPLVPATVIGCLLTTVVSCFSVRGLCARLGDQHRIVTLARKLPFSRFILSRVV